MNRSARTRDAIERHGHEIKVRSYRPSQQAHNRDITVEEYGHMQSPILEDGKNPYRNKSKGHFIGFLVFGGMMVVLVTLFLMMR